MADRDYRAYAKSAFYPLVQAAGRPDLADKLSTSDLSEERKESQFRRFKTLKVERSRTVPLSDGGFISLAAEGDHEILLVCSSSMNESEWASLSDYCNSELSLSSDEYDESTFLIVAHELKGYARLKDQYRIRERASEVLDIVDSEYHGHELRDLMGLFHRTESFLIARDNIHHGADVAEVAVAVLRGALQLRSPILDEEFAKEICGLRGLPGCLDDNLLQALTASQWRHAFLELYRCVESLFFFPWVHELRRSAGLKADVRSVRDMLRRDLNWIATEKLSVGKLFLILETERLRELEHSLPIFSEALGSKGATRKAVGERVYTVRNTLVHFEDKELALERPLKEEDVVDASRYLVAFLAEFGLSFASLFSDVASKDSAFQMDSGGGAEVGVSPLDQSESERGGAASGTLLGSHGLW